MTTELATASVDDLLSFLRSDTPPPKRAASPHKSAEVRTTRQIAERRPPTAIEVAAMGRPPRAATRYYAERQAHRDRGDYGNAHRYEERGDLLNRVECRVIAWLVCRSLGDAWRIEYAVDRYGSHRIVHRATAATLLFHPLWSDRTRYEISAENIYRKLSSITVSAERSAADIAGDIERRIISKGLFDFNSERRQTERDGRDEEIARRRSLLKVARAYGSTLKEKRCWHSPAYPEAASGHFGTVEVDGYAGFRTSIAAECGYHGGVELKIGTCDVDLAEKVAELVRRYYN